MPPLQADKLLSACKNGISIINRGDIMKTFIKAVAITLCLSVTMLFFSSSKKVEAVATGTATLATAAVVAIGTLIVGVITYIASEMSVPAVKSYVNSSDFKNSISVDDEGTATYTASGSLPSSINAEVFNAAARKATSQYNSNLKMYICDSGRPDYGPPKIPSNSLDAAITGTLLGLIADASDDDNPFYKLKDYEETGDTSISTVDGKPQKVTTSEAPTKVEVFDYLGLYYVTYSSIFDIYLYFQLENNVMGNNCYYRPYIIKDNILYVLSGDASFESSGIFHSVYDSRYSHNIITLSGSFGEYLDTSHYGNGATDANSSYGTKLANVDGSLSLAFFSYNSGYNRFNPSQPCQNPTRRQTIYGYPSAPSTYPVLFNTPVHEYQGKITTTFNNYPLSSPLLFVNPADSDLRLSESDVLSGNYDTCGFFGSESRNQLLGGSGTLGTASKMMSGLEGNAVSGGTKTTYSDLSDLEKALYALAEQQGITYEQMLEQSNIVIENGEMYIEGLDGVQHSIESLLSEFEKLLEQGSISNEQGAATVEQLTALLTYIKSLNIEGVNEYISKIESTLDSLNQRDENQAVLLGDLVGTLQEMKEYLNSLGINSISEDVKSISSAISEAQSKEDALEMEINRYEDEIFAAVPFQSDFKLYNQCKYFIETVFNYDDVLQPPNFSFYWDSDGDGEKELYNPLDLSFLEMKLTNENLADKSWFSVEIKVIDVIRYVIAIVIYGLFVMRLIKRLPTFYGSGPWAQL